MILWLSLYREQIFRWLFTGILLIWGISMSALLTFKKDKVLLFQLKEGIILPIQDFSVLDQKEVSMIEKSFLISFVTENYHFNSSNFKDNLEKQKRFFSDAGWQTFSTELSKLHSDLEINTISQGAVIISAKKSDAVTFKMKLKIFSSVNGQIKESLKGVALTVNKRSVSELTTERPYFYEVENVNEELL